MLKPVPKDLTPAQKRSVRGLLDAHFDEGLGRYLDNYSDERIASELNLPRAGVEYVRNSSYGPIRVPPEMEAAEKAVAVLEARMQPAEKTAAEIAKLLEEAKSLVEAARKALAA